MCTICGQPHWYTCCGQPHWYTCCGQPHWYTHCVLCTSCQHHEMSWAPTQLDFSIPPEPDPLSLAEILFFTPLFPSECKPPNLPVKREKIEGGHNEGEYSIDEVFIYDLSTVQPLVSPLWPPLHQPACSLGTPYQCFLFLLTLVLPYPFPQSRRLH